MCKMFDIWCKMRRFNGCLALSEDSYESEWHSYGNIGNNNHSFQKPSDGSRRQPKTFASRLFAETVLLHHL